MVFFFKRKKNISHFHDSRKLMHAKLFQNGHSSIWIHVKWNFFDLIHAKKIHAKICTYAQGLYFSEPRKFVAACYGVKH